MVKIIDWVIRMYKYYWEHIRMFSFEANSKYIRMFSFEANSNLQLLDQKMLVDLNCRNYGSEHFLFIISIFSL